MKCGILRSLNCFATGPLPVNSLDFRPIDIDLHHVNIVPGLVQLLQVRGNLTAWRAVFTVHVNNVGLTGLNLL